MYVTGTIIDFASRLHQMATATGDMPSFKSEVSGIWNTLDKNAQVKLNNEAARIYYELNQTQVPSYF